MFSGGMLGLFLLGRLFRRPGSVAAAMAVLTGVAVIAWITISAMLHDRPTRSVNLCTIIWRLFLAR